jgi:hypothetical protein
MLAAGIPDGIRPSPSLTFRRFSGNTALRFQFDLFRRSDGLGRDAQKGPEIGMAQYAYRRPNLSLPLTKNNVKAGGGSSRRNSRQTEKTSTQFLHKPKMVYF